jgi:hypothetical protein
MSTDLVKKRMELLAMAADQRNEIAGQLERYRDFARIIEKGFSLYRAILPYKFLVFAGALGFVIARPRRLLHLARYGWSLYKLVRSVRRLLT